MTMNIQPRFTKSQARKNRMDEKDRKNDENLVGNANRKGGKDYENQAGNSENIKGQIDK